MSKASYNFHFFNQVKYQSVCPKVVHMYCWILVLSNFPSQLLHLLCIWKTLLRKNNSKEKMNWYLSSQNSNKFLSLSKIKITLFLYKYPFITFDKSFVNNDGSVQFTQHDCHL